MPQQLMFDFDKPIARNPAVLTVDEIFSLVDESLLQRLEEDSRFERKPAGIHAQPFSEWICMWANTSPEGGLIAVGITDDGELQGFSRQPQEHINDIEKSGRDFVPDARYDIKRIIFSRNGVEDFILFFRVKYREDKVVESNRGHAFVRRGDSKYKLSDEEKRELAIDKGQVSFEQEASGLKYPDEFNMNAVHAFVRDVIERRGLRDDVSATKVLANRHLGKLRGESFTPNVACALLFADDPLSVIPGCSIRFQRFEGTERRSGHERNVVKDVRIEGRVPEIIAEADRVIDAQMRTFSRLGQDRKFFTAPEYPRDAWHEAIVNACVHRSYSLKNMTVFVRMFDDRLVIESPGPFPPLVTPAIIYEVHHRRNFFLMDAMFYMDFVKCENEGTRRMRDSMAAMNLPAPEFSQTEVGNSLVRVVLRNNEERRKLWIDKDAIDIVGASIFSSLTEPEKRCINFAAEHGKITVADAYRLNGIDWGTAKKILEGLVKRELMVWYSRFERDPKSYYALRTADAQNGQPE